jgi:hypothetical protein
MKKLFVTMATVATITTIAGCMPPSQNVVNTGSMALPSAGSLTGQLPAVAAANASGAVISNAPVAGQTGGLIDTLVQQLGVTPEQATGGAGSIFSVAKQSMNPTDFLQVSKAVPDMNQYLSAAPSQTASSSSAMGLMGAASSALGSSGSNLGNMASLAGSFQSLGLNADMASMFIPIILQYVQTQGGSSTMGLLKSALLP